jgi:hypothetical protein
MPLVTRRFYLFGRGQLVQSRDPCAPSPACSTSFATRTMPWPDDGCSSRKHSWEFMGRLIKPVGSVNHPGRLLRRISRRSLHVWPLPQPATPASGLDDTYLGGELPEDPFGRGPVVVTHRPRSSSPATLRYGQQQPFSQNQPFPQPFDSPVTDSSFPETDDLDNDDAKTITLSLLSPRGEECLSERSSQLSDAPFHTCLPPNSDIFTEKDDHFMTLLQQYQCTPYGEWSEIGECPNRHLMDSLYEDANEEERQDSRTLTQDSLTRNMSHPSSHPPTSLNISATQFALKAVEDLSPLSISAARVAYHRRHCMWTFCCS